MLYSYDNMEYPVKLSTANSLPTVTSVKLFKRYWLADLNVMAISYGDHWEYSQIPSRTWANILAIASTSLKAGMLCRASDLSLHTFIWDGSNWQSLNGALIRTGGSRTAVSGSGTSNLIYSPVIPPNLLGSGGKLICDIQATYTNSANVKHLYVANSLYTLLMSTRSASTGVFGVKVRLVGMLNGAGSMYALINQAGALGDPFYSSSPVSVTFDQSVSQTLNITLAQGAAEAFTVYGYDMYVERRT